MTADPKPLHRSKTLTRELERVTGKQSVVEQERLKQRLRELLEKQNAYRDSPEYVDARYRARFLLSIRPWMFKNEVAQLTGLSEGEVDSIMKELGITRGLQSFLRSKRPKRKLMKQIRNTLREIDPAFRGYIVTKNDALPFDFTGLSTDVRLTEVYGNDMRMRTNIRDILVKNMASALKNDYVYWKKEVKNILDAIRLGYSNKAIKKMYVNSPFLVDDDLIDELRELAKRVDVKKMSNALTEAEQAWILKTAREMVDALPEEILSIRYCPAYASNSKETRGMQRAVVAVDSAGNPRTFSRMVYNIPFLNWTPPKRLQMAAHSIAKDRSKLVLLHGEEPRVKAEYNDLAGKGINAKLHIARSGKMYVKTYGGGIVVTEAFANKFRYRIRSPVKEAVSLHKNGFVPDGTYVRRGDKVVTTPIDHTGYGMEDTYSPYEGRIVWLGPPKKHTRKDGFEFWTREYVVEREDKLRVGDKLMSRTGIRGVVTDIVPGVEPEVWVNIEDVWKPMDPELDAEAKRIREKMRRGEELTDEEKLVLREWKKIRNKQKASVFMERDAGDGYVFFYPEPDGFAKDYSAVGLKMSWTFLMGALEKAPFERIWVRYFYPNPELRDVMKALHLKLVKTSDGRYKFELDENEPEPDENGFVVPLEHVVGGRRYHFLYVPYRFQKFFYDNEGNLRRFGFWPDMTDTERRVMWNKNYKSFLAKRLYQALFGERYGMAIERRVVAADVPQDTIVVGERIAKLMGLKDGDLVGFRKEPVTDSNSLLTLRVKVDKSGKYDYALGINPFTAEMGQIDFDGDNAAIFLPHPGEEFIPNYPKEVFKRGVDWREPDRREYESKYMPEEELAEEVRAYNEETRAADNKEIKEFGGMRKRAFTIYPHLPVDIKELNAVFNVETVMKAKGADDKKRKELEDYIKRNTMYNRERRKLASLYMLIDDKQNFQEIMGRVIGLELQPGKYLLDKIIVWNYLGKPWSLKEMGKSISEMEKILSEVKRHRKRIEKTIEENKKDMTEVELRHLNAAARQLLRYEMELADFIEKLKREGSKK